MSRAATVARTITSGVGQVLITLGVVVLLFVVYELWFTNFTTAQDQRQLEQQLHQEWSAPPPQQGTHLVDVRLGDGIAILRMPRLGRTYHKVIVQGVGYADLVKGPGHYPGTAMPGRVGNFVVSGHRTTHGAPFYNINELRRGDAIVVETRTTWYTYRVRYHEIVDPSDIAVIAPVPDHPGRKPTQRWLTLTSCNPRFSAAQRYIVHAQLASSLPKALVSVPPALGG